MSGGGHNTGGLAFTLQQKLTNRQASRQNPRPNLLFMILLSVSFVWIKVSGMVGYCEPLRHKSIVSLRVFTIGNDVPV